MSIDASSILGREEIENWEPFVLFLPFIKESMGHFAVNCCLVEI